MTKIDIVSGFLGAGKTTLIRKLISEAFQGEKLVLIENEFGEIGIDGGFMKDAGIQITEMNSGCICCSLVGDFGTALKDVLTQFAPDRIIIEPSGVGKLSDVIRAVQGVQASASELELDSFVTVVDATKCKLYMKNFGEFFNNQVESANAIILSRTQKISQDKLEACTAMLREHNPKAAIITTPWDDLTGDQIIETMVKGHSLADEMLQEMMDSFEDEDEDECECCCDEEEEEEHEHHYHADEECDASCRDHSDEHEHRHDESHERHHEDDEEPQCGCECRDYDPDTEPHTYESRHNKDQGHDHNESQEKHDEHGHGHGEDHEKHDDHGHGHDEDHEKHDEHRHGHSEDHEKHDEQGHDHSEDHQKHDEHEHHHHHSGHDADEVFTSWGAETAHKYEKAELESILTELSETNNFGSVLRAKGMLPDTGSGWMYFDLTPGEYEIRSGEPEYTGRLCVIGSDLKEDRLKELFHLE